MKRIKWICILFALLVAGYAFAQDLGYPVEIVKSNDTLGSLWALIVSEFNNIKASQGWVLWTGLLAAILKIALSTMKVSVLRQWFWGKLPDKVKWLAAPILGVLIVFLATNPFTWKGAVLGMLNGAGAIALHHLIKAIQALPGISPVIQVVINYIASWLGGRLPADEQDPTPPAPPAA